MFNSYVKNYQRVTATLEDLMTTRTFTASSKLMELPKPTAGLEAPVETNSGSKKSSHSPLPNNKQQSPYLDNNIPTSHFQSAWMPKQ